MATAMAAPIAAAAARARAILQAARPRRAAGRAAAEPTAVAGVAIRVVTGRSPVVMARSACATSSLPDVCRSPGSLAKPRATTSSSSAGSSGRRSVTRGGGSLRCEKRTAWSDGCG